MKLIGGEVACLSKNKTDCEWGQCKNNKFVGSVWSGGDDTALLCGLTHAARGAGSGGPGYGDSNHWCEKAKVSLGFNEKNSPYYLGAAERKVKKIQKEAALAAAEVEAKRLAALQAQQKLAAAREAHLPGLGAAERERDRLNAKYIEAKVNLEKKKRDEQKVMEEQIHTWRKQVAYKDKYDISTDFHDSAHDFNEIEKEIQYKLEKRAAEIWTYADGPEGSLDKQLQFFKNGKYKGGDVPKGAIFMWTKIDIPSGWALCNGENGTPDLRDKFIFGADENDPIGEMGGKNKITKDTMPKHSHEDLGGWDKYSVGTVGGMSAGAGKWKKQFIRSSLPEKATFSKTKEVGGNKDFFPLYNRLAFIMKL
jgi:hypothetical protein